MRAGASVRRVMRLLTGSRVLFLALTVGLTVLVALPATGGLPNGPAAASAPVLGAIGAPASATALPSSPSTASSSPGAASAGHAGPSGSGASSSTRSSDRFLGVVDPPTTLDGASPQPAAKSTGPTFDWDSAYVGYGPPWPPADLMLGVGEGAAVDNALDEFVFFGGLASGGLSNATWTYEYYLNESNVMNSTENGSSTSSPISPPARANMTFVADQPLGEVLMFGGITNLTTQATANDTWIYYIQNDTWAEINTSVAPPPRESMAFAVDPTDGIALVFGGIAPNFESAKVTGTVIWGDTWEFNFHDDAWTQINTSSDFPGDLFGASMTWDPNASMFILTGGCDFDCTSATWAFSPTTERWSEIPVTGEIPSPRAGATFAWDPGSDLALLYGGYSFDTSGGYNVFGGTYEFLPTGDWIAINPTASGAAPIYQPSPTYGIPGIWADFPGCNSMPVWGGSVALSSPPEFVYEIQPNNDTPSWQCWGFTSVPYAPQPPKECSEQSLLVVTVRNARTNAAIPDAIIEISGYCQPAVGHTGPSGSYTFTTNTPDNITINVSAEYYHGNSTYYNYTYNNTPQNTSGELTRDVTVFLVPYPALNVQVRGNDGGVEFLPIAGAAVIADNYSVIAVTDAEGWGNDSAVSEFNQTLELSATATNYSTTWKNVYIPYTGEVNATLVILEAAVLTISVVNSVTGAPVPNASGLITRTSPGLPAPFYYSAAANGTYSVRLPAGNYTATAGAPGFQLNKTPGSADLPWIFPAKMVIRLSPELGTNESVRLLNAWTHDPIGGGYVYFGNDPPIETNSAGWGNGTDLLPPGPIGVIGRANGYLVNSSSITLAYLTTLPPLTLNLTPYCGGPCVASSKGQGPLGSPFLPTGGSALVFLLSAPAILAVAGALYAIGLSARRGRLRPEAPSGSVGATPAPVAARPQWGEV